MSAETEPNLPDPTALAFSALTGGQVQFYAATAGRESAELVSLSLSLGDVGRGRPLSRPPRPRRIRWCNWCRCTTRRCRWWRRC